jgi:RimJ/RimL family protein N-acetyltransferase
MNTTLRKTLPQDAYDVTDCVIACWQTAYRGIVPDSYLDNLHTEREERAERFRKYQENPDLDAYCVMLENKMVGFLTINKKDGEIWAIYLLDEVRSKGYGTEILNFAIDELKNMGHEIIVLWVFEENHKARRFYERNGFRFDGAKRENDKYGKMLVQIRYEYGGTNHAR